MGEGQHAPPVFQGETMLKPADPDMNSRSDLERFISDCAGQMANPTGWGEDGVAQNPPTLKAAIARLSEIKEADARKELAEKQARIAALTAELSKLQPKGASNA